MAERLLKSHLQFCVSPSKQDTTGLMKFFLKNWNVEKMVQNSLPLGKHKQAGE